MRARILVVDDVQEIIDLYRLLLEDEGYEVYVSTYTYEGVKDVERLRPNLIVLDLLFNTRLDGWELLQKLRTHTSTKTIPILLCTAFMSIDSEKEVYLQKQGIPVMYKPFKVEAFLQIVRHLLKKNSFVQTQSE